MRPSGKPATTRQRLNVFPKKNVLGIHDYTCLGVLALILGGIFFIFNFYGVTDIGYDINRTTRSAFFWLYDRWATDWRSTWYAHSHWVPLVSALLIWRDRLRLASIQKQTCYAGLVIIILSLLLHWAGAKSEQTRLSIISLIGLAWGIPLFICGWPTAKRLLFPCGLLLFSLPLNFFDTASYPLRIFAAIISSGLLSGLGIDVSRVGSAIIDNNAAFTIDLADSQSSIFAVTAIISYTLVYSYIIRARLIFRLALVALSIPLLVLSNIIRGVTVMLMAAAFGDGAGTIVYKYISGPITLLFAFGGISLIGYYIHRKENLSVQLQGVDREQTGATAKSAWFTTLAIILVSAIWIPNKLDVEYINESGVSLSIPNVVGAWSGGPILFCHNPEKPDHFSSPLLQTGDPCPDCGERLFEMSIIERRLLPADTTLKKSHYTNNLNRGVYFTIVLSGKKRSSIHRPEVCLVGPNSEIDRSFFHTVTIDDGTKLNVKVLEMIHKRRKPDGTVLAWTSYYAYWFAGINRETPYHLKRMMWMASDRLFYDRSYRWAYISVSGARPLNNTSYLSEIEDFLQDAYPFLRKDQE